MSKYTKKGRSAYEWVTQQAEWLGRRNQEYMDQAKKFELLINEHWPIDTKDDEANIDNIKLIMFMCTRVMAQSCLVLGATKEAVVQLAYFFFRRVDEQVEVQASMLYGPGALRLHCARQT